jgi:acyl-CoA thioester hydrolase
MLESYAFKHTIRVRWSEIDGQRIVFNGNYLDYLDTAMVEYFRHLGLDTLKTGQPDEFDYVVAHLEIDFYRPATYDDLLDIYVKITHLGNARFDVAFTVVRQGAETPNLRSVIHYVCYDNVAKKSKPIPAWIREKIIAFEPGLRDRFIQ